MIYLTKSLFELTANCQESKQFICCELPSESVTNFTKTTTFISKQDSNRLQSLSRNGDFQKSKSVYFYRGNFFKVSFKISVQFFLSKWRLRIIFTWTYHDFWKMLSFSVKICEKDCIWSKVLSNQHSTS